MNLAGVGESFADTILDGPLIVGAAVAMIAGFVSFLSPCVLPLVPGYLSYVSGVAGTEATQATQASGSGGTAVLTRQRVPVRSRTLIGAVLFVLGFTAVFVAYGALFGSLGRSITIHQKTIEQVLGVVTIVLGLAFMGVIPGMKRDLRIHRLPGAGLAGAPVLGVVFGVGWTPCMGPTLGAVQSLAFTTSSAGRGALLSAAYCIGLGLPFILAAFGFRWLTGAFAVVRRNAVWVTRVGGAMLVVLGVLLVGGWWNELMAELRSWALTNGGPGTSI